MALTPVEIRHLNPGTSLFGYKKDATDRVLAEIASSFEDVWRERADLADKVEALEADILRFRELESLLRTTLISAERAAAELKDQARREADLVMSEAHAEARAVTRRALTENERLRADSVRFKEQLRTALATFEYSGETMNGAAPEEPSEEAVPSQTGVTPVH